MTFSFVDFASGRVKCIDVRVEVMDVSPNLIGDYTNDADFRVNFQAELNQIWLQKNQQLAQFESQVKS